METLPRHYIFGIIMFVFIILTGLYMINDLRNEVPGLLDSEDKDDFDKFNLTFNQFDKINESISNIQSNVENPAGDEEGLLGKFGMLESLISSAWNTLKLLVNSLSFMNDVFAGLTTIFGVPAFIPTLLILVVVVLIIFAIYSAIFQKDI